MTAPDRKRSFSPPIRFAGAAAPVKGTFRAAGNQFPPAAHRRGLAACRPATIPKQAPIGRHGPLQPPRHPEKPPNRTPQSVSRPSSIPCSVPQARSVAHPPAGSTSGRLSLAGNPTPTRRPSQTGSPAKQVRRRLSAGPVLLRTARSTVYPTPQRR